MNRRFLLIASALVCGGLLVYLLAELFLHSSEYIPADKPARAAKLSSPPIMPMAEIKPTQQVRLAIGGLGLRDDAQNGQVANLLTAELSSAKGLQLVERQSLDKVLRELQLNLSGLVRAQDAVRAGKLLRADWFLLGSLASAGASNAAVVRVVDAKTGIMRDVGIVPFTEAGPGLARSLAGFVRDCREGASNPRTRVYLALGALEDLSVNDRLADFPAQLRAQLIADYRGSEVTLLEREYVESLLREVQLDLAGLTENGGTYRATPMQSAFWVVDGNFQSYETATPQVELQLRVQRVFGRSTNLMVMREAVSPALFSKVKGEIDEAMSSGANVLVPTKISETYRQISRGTEIVGQLGGAGQSRRLLSSGDDQTSAREARNVEEARRAFETALLLEPTNREAKMLLAACLVGPRYDNLAQALDLYRQILDEPIQDRWTEKARNAIVWDLQFHGYTRDNRVHWFENAASQASNPSTREFYLQQVESLNYQAGVRGDSDPSGHDQFVEDRMFENLRRFDQNSPDHGLFTTAVGVEGFVQSYGTNRTAASQRLADLLPKIKTEAPRSVPYVMVQLVMLQDDTNSPVIPEFEKMLDSYAEHPKEVPNNFLDFWGYAQNAYNWGMQHKAWGLSAKVIEAKLRARAASNLQKLPDDDEEHMSLAYAWLKAERWKEALKAFEGWSNQPVYIGNPGPWGRAFTVVSTSKLANTCREKLGISQERDPREFEMSDTGLCFCGPAGFVDGTFATDTQGVWVGNHGRLSHVGFDLRTNLVIELEMSPATPITAICLGPSNVWIGTAGEGLIQLSKTSGKCHKTTEKDGLLMDFILSLKLADDALWIGYGESRGGGLGKLDLSTHQATAFTPSLTPKTGPEGQPPRAPITGLAMGDPGQLWLIAQKRVRRYEIGADKWDAISALDNTAAVLVDSDVLYAGESVDPYQLASLRFHHDFGLRTWSLANQTLTKFPGIDFLPSGVSSMASDGRNLWVGGMAYLAMLDLDQNKVIKYSYVVTRNVEKIQVAGGYVWAQFNGRLWRAGL
jgi:hypothetical protein